MQLMPSRQVDPTQIWPGKRYASSGRGKTDGSYRIQYRRMCLAFHQSVDPSSHELADLAVEIEEISSRLTGPWAAQYVGFAKLLCAMDKFRRGDPTASKYLAKQAKVALTILREAFFSNSLLEATGAQISLHGQTASCSDTPKKPVAARPARTSTHPSHIARKPLSPKSAISNSANRIVTPPRKTNRGLDGHSPPDHKLASSSCKLDNPLESLSLLETIAAVLGLYEHTFLRLGYLRLIKHLCIGYSADGFLKPCLELAGEYQSLGQWERAQDVLRQAQDIAAKGDLSDESRILLCLREAEIFSLRGDTAHG